jgi:hypothetical protein
MRDRTLLGNSFTRTSTQEGSRDVYPLYSLRNACSQPTSQPASHSKTIRAQHSLPSPTSLTVHKTQQHGVQRLNVVECKTQVHAQPSAKHPAACDQCAQA